MAEFLFYCTNPLFGFVMQNSCYRSKEHLDKALFDSMLFSLKSFHPEVHQPPAHALILFHSLQMTMKRPREQCKIKPQWPATVLT